MKPIIHFIFSSLICFFISLNANAQVPANDEPCNAIDLTPTAACNYQIFTTQNATATAGVTAPGCALYSGGDVWFKAVVPCTGSIKVDTDPGVVTDGGMAFYTGSCSNLTLLDCNDDGGTGFMPQLIATGLTPGQTIWIRFWEFGNNTFGNFGICATIPPPPGPGGNCNSAQPFCTSNVYTFNNNTNVPSLGGGGIYDCLLTTPNPVF